MVLTLTACGGSDDDDNPSVPTSTNSNCNDTRIEAIYGNLEFPHLKATGNNLVLIHRTATYGVNYSVEWDTDKHAQRWSCYQMTTENSVTNTSRWYGDRTVPFGQYPNDPLLPAGQQFTDDPYWNSGYDHGHICPSADRLCSQEANIQTFYMTNMQPQVNGFNAGVWVNMENQLRIWNTRNFRDVLYVCKGGTIDSEGNIIRYLGSGRNRIPVPKYFFMAILCKNRDAVNGGYKALGFWVEHTVNGSTNLDKYVVNIDELERLTGIDFFCNLPDNIENAVESLPRENVLRAWKLQ